MWYCFLFLLIGFFSFSQEQISYRIDRFSGINGALLEPTHTLINQNSWDINLINLDVYHQENFAYISKQSLLGLNSNEEIQVVNQNKNIYGSNTSNVLDFNKNKNLSAINQIDILGPSFSYRKEFNERDFSVGFFSRARSVISGFNVDKGYSYYNFLRSNYNNDFKIGKGKIVGANWSELGLNFATRINQNYENQWLIGINLKHLKGYDAAIIHQKNQITASVSDSILSVNNYHLDAAFSSAYNFENDKYELKPKGKGFSGDIGITYTENKYKRHVETEYEYLYKISLSVLDFGYLKYEGEKHQYVGSLAADRINFDDFENAQNPSEAFKILSEKVYNDPNKSKIDNHFIIGMPTSLFLSYDKNFSQQKHFGFAIQQRIPVLKNSLKKANLLIANYSIQKNTLGYGISTSLYEYKNLQFGGYLRIGPLFLGSENIFPIFFKQKKLDSFDVYFGIKLFPFWDTVEKKRNRQKCDCDK